MKLFKQIRESFDPLDEARARKSGGKKKSINPPKGGSGKKLSPKMKERLRSGRKGMSKQDLYKHWLKRLGESRMFEASDNSAKEYDKLYKNVERLFNKKWRKLEKDGLNGVKIVPPTRNDFKDSKTTYWNFWAASYEEAVDYYNKYYFDPFRYSVMNEMAYSFDIEYGEESLEWFEHFAANLKREGKIL